MSERRAAQKLQGMAGRALGGRAGEFFRAPSSREVRRPAGALLAAARSCRHGRAQHLHHRPSWCTRPRRPILAELVPPATPGRPPYRYSWHALSGGNSAPARALAAVHFEKS